MSARPWVSGLLLAAGSASRFGRSKQLEKLGGRSLVARAVLALLESEVDEVVVVVGHDAREVRSALGSRKVKVVVNEGYRTGLSSSLRLGVESLDPRSEAVVVCLADQPFVDSDLVDRVVRKFVETGADAVAASSGELVAPPVLLSRSLYGEVAALTGDKGAKGVAVSARGFVTVEVDRDTLLDVDTEHELQRARQLLDARARRVRGLGGGRPARGRLSSGK